MRLERDEQQLLYHDRFRSQWQRKRNRQLHGRAEHNRRGACGTLTVAGRNVTITQDAGPIANDDTATTDEDTPVDINVLANDSDPDGDTLNVVSVTQGANGAVSINPDKTVHYAPAVNFFGSDSFTYTIDDGHGGTATATVNVTVNAVNDAPVFTINLLSQTVQYSDPITPVTVSVSDVDDSTADLTLTVLSSIPAGLTVTPTGVGSLTIFRQSAGCGWGLSDQSQGGRSAQCHHATQQSRLPSTRKQRRLRTLATWAS